MPQPGRRSAAALAVVGDLASLPRIAPPSGLTEEQRSIWLVTVNSKPAEWFDESHAPLLLAYVREVATANMLAREIDSFDRSWLADDDGIKRYDRLTKMQARAAGVMHNLARSMRLTQQAIYRADKAATLAGRSGGRRKPWQHEG